ncbi:MAG: PaaI family thioesterase [Acidobacteriota bacterium]
MNASPTEDVRKHYRALEAMYDGAPINAFFDPTLEIGDGEATVTIEVMDKHHHAAGAAHGSVYFKMLDDAAFFAASSCESEWMVLTASFTTYLTRPIMSGLMRSEGRVVNRTRTQFIVEAVAYDSHDREVGRGSGVFVRGKIKLSEIPDYAASRARDGA